MLKKYKCFLFLIFFLSIFIFANTYSAISDPLCSQINCSEASRTWESARVYTPSEVSVKRLTMPGLKKQMESTPEKLYPLAIYLHGCAGLWAGSERRGRLLAELGFIVIAPDSFARKNKPISCLPYQYRGGLHRGTLALRQEEAMYAISAGAKLPWVDPKRIILIGLSEGGITTATLIKPSFLSIKARVIEGWGCNSSWEEYAGLNSQINEPVISFVGNMDPWFRHPSLQGDCGEFMKDADSISVVYTKPPLSKTHTPLDYKLPKLELKEFLCKHVWCEN